MFGKRCGGDLRRPTHPATGAAGWVGAHPAVKVRQPSISDTLG